MLIKQKLSRRKVLFLNALKQLGGVATTREIAQKTGLNANGISQTLGGINKYSHCGDLVSSEAYVHGHTIWRLMPLGLAALRTKQMQLIFAPLSPLRLIFGYLVVCEGKDKRILFGPVSSFVGEGIENFETNGMKVFDSHDEAKAHKKFLDPVKFGYPDAKAKIALVKILIAENQSSFNQMKADDLNPYIVICGYGASMVQLLGACRSDCLEAVRQFDSGGLIFEKAEPFINLSDAQYLATEVMRQGVTTAVIAHYHLEFIR